MVGRSEVGEIEGKADRWLRKARPQGKAEVVVTTLAKGVAGVSLFVVLLSAILSVVAARSASRIIRRLSGQYVPPVPEPGPRKRRADVIDAEFEETGVR